MNAAGFADQLRPLIANDRDLKKYVLDSLSQIAREGDYESDQHEAIDAILNEFRDTREESEIEAAEIIDALEGAGGRRRKSRKTRRRKTKKAGKHRKYSRRR